jgi:hypothetical protein
MANGRRDYSCSVPRRHHTDRRREDTDLVKTRGRTDEHKNTRPFLETASCILSRLSSSRQVIQLLRGIVEGSLGEPYAAFDSQPLPRDRGHQSHW